MMGMLRWGRAVASLLVVVGVLTSAWATCVEGATLTATQQMACCKAGHHHCPMKDSASDCCKQAGRQIESQATIVKAASFNTPTLMAVPLPWVMPPAALSAAHVQRRVSYDSSPPGLRLDPPP